MTFRALPFVALTAFLFGSTLVASRFSVGQFDPLVYIAIRLAIASLGYLLLFIFSKQHTFPTDFSVWWKAGILGVVGTAFNLVAMVSALQYISSGTTSVLLTTLPAVTVFLAQFFLPDERLNMRQWMGVLLAFGGAVMLTIAGENGIPDMNATNPLGYILVFAAIATGSTMTIYTRIYLRELDSIHVASIRMFIAAMVVIPLAFIFADFDFTRVQASGYFAVLYASFIGTLAGFFVHLYTVQRFGAVPGSMVTYLLPIFAGVGGIVVLGEQFTPILIVGFLIILCGIILTQRGKQKVSVGD